MTIKLKKYASYALLGVTLLTSLAAAETLVVKNPKQDFPPPQLGISPPRIESEVLVSQGKRLDQSITFYNYSPKAKTLRITLHDTNAGHRMIKSNEKTLAPWTILNPTEFTIPGKGEQTIRLSIRPPQGFPSGTHHAMLKIVQHVPDSVKMDADGKGVTISLGSSYGLPLIVHVK